MYDRSTVQRAAKIALFVGLATACSIDRPMAPNSDPNSQLIYVGTYTRETSAGIYAYRFDASNGSVEPIGLVAEISDPSFLALHPNGLYLYAVSETDDYDADGSGSVVSYELEPASASLSKLNEVSSRGGWPCHLGVDPSGRMLIVANYESGSVASFPIRKDGSLGNAASFFQHTGSSVNERQQGPHAHSADFSADARLAFFSDLGLDQVKIYRADPQAATLSPGNPAHVAVEPGSGPRHFSQHPSGRFAYGVNELGSTISVYSLDPEAGVLEVVQTITTLPNGFSGSNTTAEIYVHPSGQFVYASNRGHDSIAIFSIETKSGHLESLGHVSTGGNNPRHFAFDRTGRFLMAANQSSDNVVVFSLDPDSGALTPTGSEFAVDAPVCLLFR